jgi:hypothetical protein
MQCRDDLFDVAICGKKEFDSDGTGKDVDSLLPGLRETGRHLVGGGVSTRPLCIGR